MRFPNTFSKLTSVLISTALGLAVTASGLAADPTTQPQDPVARGYFAVAAARTHAELALRSAQRFFEENKTTMAATGDSLDNARSKSLSLIERALTNEQHKPEADRSDEVSEDLNRRSHSITERWQRLYAVDRPAIGARFDNASATLVTIGTVLTATNTLEQQWKDLELNLSPLEGAYLEIARRADRAREQGELAVSDLRRQRDDWEATYRSTLASVGPRAGPRPTGIPSGL